MHLTDFTNTTTAAIFCASTECELPHLYESTFNTLNFYLTPNTLNINQLQELTEEENKNKDYLTIIKQVEKQTKTKIFDDDGEVLPDVLKKAKDKALVDTFDTEYRSFGRISFLHQLRYDVMKNTFIRIPFNR